jgi:hypothetical protein
MRIYKCFQGKFFGFNQTIIWMLKILHFLFWNRCWWGAHKRHSWKPDIQNSQQHPWSSQETFGCT